LLPASPWIKLARLMKPKTNKPELMAPAGDLACAFAAFDAGADAIYAGLGDFNARQRAENFTAEQLASLAAWARQHHRRVYITLNTLLKDTELTRFIEVLGEIDSICPDAVIVQDLGVLHMLREHFPHVPVHASTQMGAHNSAGVNLLHRLGAERVILERQVTLAELALIRERTSVELEVFVHGALCCSLSGMCLFSSWMGGWSGNRGRCKQPCRRRFFAPEGNGFFFSTQDLYSLDSLQHLVDMGINALKIEGRLRGPDYVSGIVSAYRRVLDAPPDQRQAVIKEARAVLSRTAGRKWSPGFRSAASCAQVIAHQRPGGSGRLCGKVEKVKSNGFFIRPSRRIGLGDTLRIQPPSAEAGPALEVTRLKSAQGRNVQQLRKSERGFVHCDKEVLPQSNVYLIAQKTADYRDRIEGLACVEKTMALSISLDSRGVTVETLNMPQPLQWHVDFDIALAQKAALSKDRVARAFSRIKHETWQINAARIDIKGDLFLQDRQLRQLRQAFVKWLEAQGGFDRANLISPGRLCLEADQAVVTEAPPRTKGVEHTVCCTPGKPSSKEEIRAIALDKDISNAHEVILPAFCPEAELDELLQRLTRALDTGIRRIRVTSLYQFELLGRLAALRNLQISTGYPLSVCNRYAVQELRTLGAHKVMLWPEMEEEAVVQLAQRFGSDAEVFCAGRLPVLVTRARIPVSGRITGGHGQVFKVEKQGGLSYVFPEVSISLPAPSRSSTFRDITSPESDKRSDFNYSRQWA
jgi:U32 family peptidase